eukprot:scaffold64637_cov44-Phaeocystis_antarctica.AAC.1
MRLELGEEVDEDKECHGADWQGTKQPYQLALTPIMNAIRAGCHHAHRMNDGFHHELAAAVCGVQNRLQYFGVVLNQAKLRMHVGMGWGPRRIKCRRF